MAFERASEEPFRRRPADLVRLLLAVAVCVLLSQVSQDSSSIERAVFDSVNRLPAEFEPLADAMTDVATLWTVGLVAAASLWARRWRLARDMLAAGLLAWMAARALGLVLDSGLRAGLHAALHSTVSAEFPDVPMAVSTAVVAVASPFLTRPYRWVGRVAVALLVPAEMFSGSALPRSLVCAVAVGIAAAAAVHVTIGSPAGRPTPEQVALALRELGLAARDVRLAATQPPGCTLMLAEDATSRYVVKVLGRDDRDARLAGKLWRWLWYRSSGLPLFFTRVQEIEHQAYVMLVAERAGVRVAPLVVAGTAGPGAAVLAELELPGTPLAELPEQEVTTDLLTDVWVQVARLHDNSIAHGRLTTSRVVADDDAAVLIGFDHANAGAGTDARAADVAELLAVTSHQVGLERAVSAALQVLGPEGLAPALPLLQAPVLSKESRALIGLRRTALNEHVTRVREHTAQQIGEEPPTLQQLTRVSGSTALLSVGLVATLASLLVVVGNPAELGHTLTRARPWPLVDACLLTAASTVGFALALAGSTRHRLPFWSNVTVQWAALFSNIVVPVGSQIVQIRYLQRRGVPTAEAVSAGGIVNLSGGVAGQLLVLGIAVELSPRTVTLAHVPQGAVTVVTEVATAAVLVTGLLFLALPALRRRVWPPMRRSVGAIVDTLRSPRHLALLIGGSALAYLLVGLALAAVLQSFGQGIDVAEAVSISVGIGLLAQIVPFPGGVGAVSAVGLAGALISLGVPHGAAVATALVDQLITQYLPVLPGWFATRWLLENGDL